MDPALGLSKRNYLQRRERRPSPPVAHDCEDPLELGPVERHPALCHSRTSTDLGGRGRGTTLFIPHRRDNVL